MLKLNNKVPKKLGIDLRFYRPEPYGLAVHIRDLMICLVPELMTSTKVSKTVLIFDSRIKYLDLSLHLPWWDIVVNSDLFEIYFSDANYYSLKEQTSFLLELYKLNCNLMYFFTFNYPILYNKPYIYQVLDLNIPKTRSHLSIKVQAMLLSFRSGISNSKHVFFLGKNTRSDAVRFSRFNFTDPNKPRFKVNTVIYNGINPIYLTVPSANRNKASQISIDFSEHKQVELQKIKEKFTIIKPYFFFISVWRKYKNIERLAYAFDDFNSLYNDQYQLVLGGGQDSKYPEILENIKKLSQFKKGNIIITGRIDIDEDVILLYDGAEALIAPPLSEGFGLWMVEAASRGLPVIASDIPVFHEIASDIISYFDPLSTDDIICKLIDFVDQPETKRQANIKKLYDFTSQFRWIKTAHTIIETIEENI